jgi:hypothetical protein
MYGFSLLDDLHNFFPEILYDDSLFPDQRFGWFRYRASMLFPNIFTRQMNMYKIYNADERRRMFQEWINSQANVNTWVNNSQPNVNYSQLNVNNSQPNVNTWVNNSAAAAAAAAAAATASAAPHALCNSEHACSRCFGCA